MIRRNLTWGERLTLAEWYLDRCGIREYEKTGDTSARDKAIVFLFGEKQSKESIAQSFGLTTAGVSRIINKLKKENGLAAGKSAAKGK